MTHAKYIVDLIRRQKRGELSIAMAQKYIECTMNVFHFELSKSDPIYNINDIIIFGIELVSGLKELRRKRFEKGGVDIAGKEHGRTWSK